MNIVSLKKFLTFPAMDETIERTQLLSCRNTLFILGAYYIFLSSPVNYSLISWFISQESVEIIPSREELFSLVEVNLVISHFIPVVIGLITYFISSYYYTKKIYK